MRIMKMFIAVVCLFSLSLPTFAGTDSAGTSTLGGQEQTDMQTQGGDLNTDGGGLDLSGGDVSGAGAVGANDVTATTIKGGNVSVTGAISNSNTSTVSISDEVNVSGAGKAVRFKVSDTSPSAAGDATSKEYVDGQIQNFSTWAAGQAQSGSGVIYSCVRNGVRVLTTSPISGWQCSQL